MTEPTPFKDDDSALDADERRLLRAGLGMGVPRGAKRAVWLALGAAVPSVAAASTVTTSALTAVSLVKYGAVGVLLGATTMTTVAFVRPPSGAPPSAPATSAAAVAQRAPSTVEPPRVIAPPADVAPAVVSTVPVPTVPPPAAVSPIVAPPSLDVALPDTESRRIAAARALKHAGRTREALAALDGIARELPQGELVQEREALAIEALLTLGEGVAARRRATAFLLRFPGSPHTATARRALE
jgi:hypothetical protein